MGYLICYWERFKNVLWCSDGPDYGDPDFKRDPDAPELLFFHMQNLIVHGLRTEILEYIPDALTENNPDVDYRCDVWRKQLREQGYDIIENFRYDAKDPRTWEGE